VEGRVQEGLRPEADYFALASAGWVFCSSPLAAELCPAPCAKMQGNCSGRSWGAASRSAPTVQQCSVGTGGDRSGALQCRWACAELACCCWPAGVSCCCFAACAARLCCPPVLPAYEARLCGRACAVLGASAGHGGRALAHTFLVRLPGPGRSFKPHHTWAIRMRDVAHMAHAAEGCAASSSRPFFTHFRPCRCMPRLCPRH